MSGERRHKEERKEKEEKLHKEKKEKKSEEKKERSDRKDKSSRKDRHKHRASSREKERHSPSSHSPSSASSNSGGGGAVSRDVLPPGSPSHGALSAKKFRALLDAEPAPQGRRRAMSVDTSEAMAPREINSASLRSSNATESSPPRRPSTTTTRDGPKEKEPKERDKKEKTLERKEHKERDSKESSHTQKQTKKSVAIASRKHQSSPSKSSGRSKSGASPARPRSPSVSISVSSASDDDELLSSGDDNDLPHRRSGLNTSASSASSSVASNATAAPPPIVPPVSIKQAANEPRTAKSVRIAADAKTTDAPSRAPDSPVLLWIYWTGKSARSVFVATSLDGERTLLPLTYRPNLGVHGAALLAPAGRVSYRFLVDYIWMHDPNQPSMAAQSGPTSLLNWRLASGVHTVAAEFRWPRGTEKSVALAGSWNNWSQTPLTHPSASSSISSSTFSSSSSYWTVTVPLSPGMHVYKFIIDGVSWRIDPSAHSCRSPEGHINSWRIV